MQHVRFTLCFVCNVSILLSALYAKCLYYVLYMQSVLLSSALYAKCLYYVVLYMQSVLIM